MSAINQLKSLLLALSYQEREVVLSSGLKSNFYIDVKQTSLHPEGLSLIGQLLFEKIIARFPDVEAVGGPTLGADPLVSAVSLVSWQKRRPLPAFIIRKEPKGHGTGAWIEGARNLKTGMNVVVLEDVLTTGKSGLLAVSKARDFGLNVLGLAAVVDRQEGGLEELQKQGISLISLVTKIDLLGLKDKENS